MIILIVPTSPKWSFMMWHNLFFLLLCALSAFHIIIIIHNEY